MWKVFFVFFLVTIARKKKRKKTENAEKKKVQVSRRIKISSEASQRKAKQRGITLEATHIEHESTQKCTDWIQWNSAAKLEIWNDCVHELHLQVEHSDANPKRLLFVHLRDSWGCRPIVCLHRSVLSRGIDTVWAHIAWNILPNISSQMVTQEMRDEANKIIIITRKKKQIINPIISTMMREWKCKINIKMVFILENDGNDDDRHAHAH